MPTESFEPILDRDTAIVSAKPIIDLASSPSNDKDFQTISQNDKLSMLLRAPSIAEISEVINKLKTNHEKRTEVVPKIWTSR